MPNTTAPDTLADIRLSFADADVAELQLWTLTRMNLDEIVVGDIHEMIVAAATVADARQWAYRAATLRNDAMPLVWLEAPEHIVRVSHLGEPNADQESGVVLADTWPGASH